MKWPWRRRYIEEALRAKAASERERAEVEELVSAVVERGAKNNLAPLFARALRGS